MTRSLKLIPVGSSTGMILPADILLHLGVAQGDYVRIVETPEGTYLRAHNPESERENHEA